MPRTELSRLLAAALLAVSFGATGAPDPHLDPGKVPGGCSACHSGHGRSGSPMLRGSVAEVCLACHDSRAGADREVRRGMLAADARPPLVGAAFALASPHPLDRDAGSRFDPSAVTCTSCHSPHRGGTAALDALPLGQPRPSTRAPGAFEFELCGECHGNGGPGPRDPRDVGRLFDPDSRSSHPVKGPSRERSPSVAEDRQGRRVSCTDCHASPREAGSRGPHGSLNSPLLAAPYATVDGADEASQALCFACHDRAKVLDSPSFPLHRAHVEKVKASCATCHSAHGSIRNRALIRFGEETTIAGAVASVSTGRLAFESDSTGSGRCWLTCHGADHSPKSYGTEALKGESLRRLGAAGSAQGTPTPASIPALPPGAARPPRDPETPRLPFVR